MLTLQRWSTEQVLFRTEMADTQETTDDCAAIALEIPPKTCFQRTLPPLKLNVR